ncbi:MAG: hypothetical protein ACLTMP_04230 [Eggerthella lenta]
MRTAFSIFKDSLRSTRLNTLKRSRSPPTPRAAWPRSSSEAACIGWW